LLDIQHINVYLNRALAESCARLYRMRRFDYFEAVRRRIPRNLEQEIEA
jgi:hypothetical protein